MKIKDVWKGSLLLACVLCLTFSSYSYAKDDYPNKPIQMIICYQPGDTDMNLRPFVELISEEMRQPISFIYKPGAGGSIGATFAAKSKPDGYTLLGSTPGAVMLSPLYMDGLSYTLDDFATICRLATQPIVLAVKSDSKFKTIKDLVEEAKKSPGTINFGSTGTMGSGHLPVEMFMKLAGIRMNHVPNPGSGPAITALLGGHVDVAGAGISPVIPHLKSGALRALGIFSSERSKLFPEIPTFKEAGYPAVYSYWYGLFSQKDTPKPIVNKVYEVAKKISGVNKAQLEERLRNLGSEISLAGPDEFRKETAGQRDMLKVTIDSMKSSQKPN